MSREIFIDTGNIAEINKWGRRLDIKGVTTNPLILFRENQEYVDMKEAAKEICSAIDAPVSIELTTILQEDSDIEKMIKEAREYHDLHKNVVLKVPMTVDGRGLVVIKSLSKEGVKVNATAMMTFEQMLLAVNAGARYVSLFYRRSREYFESGGLSPEASKEKALGVIKNTARFIEESQANCQIIVGSIREAEDVGDVFAAGAHIVTIPPKVLEQMIYNERTKETLEEFDQAWQKYLASKGS